MMVLGFVMALMFIIGFFTVLTGKAWNKRWLLRWALYSIPFPFIASLCGWFVAEHGRQPWTVYQVLPTPLSSSSINAADIAFTLIMFCLIYTVLFIVEMFLMFKFSRLGPSSLHTGRYHHETAQIE